MNNNCIALIEDEVTKRDSILGFVSSQFPVCEVVEAKSVKSGRALIREKKPGLLLLDMSLPTFEVSDVDSGGRPQGLGGIEIMRYMLKDSTIAPVIVVTGYQEFSEKSRYMSLAVLKNQLESEFPETFKGLVTFNVLSDDWMEELSLLINEVFIND